MEDNKSMFYIVSIIGIVAIVGMVVLIINSTHSNGVVYARTPTVSTATDSGDSAGQAINVDPNKITLPGDHGGVKPQYQIGNVDLDAGIIEVIDAGGTRNIYAIPAHGVIAEANNAGPVNGIRPSATFSCCMGDRSGGCSGDVYSGSQCDNKACYGGYTCTSFYIPVEK